MCSEWVRQAGSWDTPRRLVAKVAWHAGELFPRVGFIVTNLRLRSKNVTQLYNQRGTAEHWIRGEEHHHVDAFVVVPRLFANTTTPSRRSSCRKRPRR